MKPLWLRLLRGGGRSAALEVFLPFLAGAVITVVLLLLLGLHQGLDHRGDRTAWRTPEPATGQATAIQAGFTDYIGDRPVAVIELAALTADPPAVPGMDGFPQPDEVWASPALAQLVAELPADQLGGRFPGPVTAELPPSLLEGPDELVAVIGRSPADPVMQQELPEHLWDGAASVTPTEVDSWSTTPGLYFTVYQDIAVLVVALAAHPLVSLGRLASRLLAGRRQRRIATLRLLGASTPQVVRLTTTELVTFAGIGAIFGAVVHRLTLPWTSSVPIKGQHWFLSDVQPSLLLTLAVVVTVVAVLTVAALTGLIRAVRDPIGTYRSAQPDTARLRWWSVVFIGAVVALFWLRSDPFVAVAFTFVVILGWGLISTGPWIVYGLGRLLARRAFRPATFLAGRRLSDSPHSAWRAVGGMALAAFLAGFVAISLPVGLGNVSDYASRANQLDLVVPSSSVDGIAHEVTSVVRAENLDADVEVTTPPFWLGSDSWATLSLTTHGPASEIDRARTALTAQGLWGPELRLSDDLPTVWMVQDGIVVSLLLIPIAALVALASMVIGTVARILDQRGSLLALSLSGTPQSLLIAVQRREIVLPTVLLAGVASIAGIASGASLGVVNPLNPYTITTFAGVLAIGAIALLLADRTMRPVLERVSTDLSERE